MAGSITQLGRVLLLVAAASSAAAGVGHLSVARDHSEHAFMVAFFVAAGLGQLAWAATIQRRLVLSARLIGAGAVAQLGIVAIWAASRTVGVPGAGGVEAVGIGDLGVTFLEVVSAGAAGVYLVLPTAARRLKIPSGERVVVMAVSLAVVLALPSAALPHDEGHEHGESAELASHGHGEAAMDTPVGAGHGHGHAGEAAVGATRDEHHGGAGVRHQEAGEQDEGHGHGGAGEAAHHSSPPGHAHDAGDGASRTAGGGLGASVRYGPINIPPGSVQDSTHGLPIHNVVLPDLEPPCSDCYLTEMRFDLVYPNGTSANYDTGLMNHHLVMFNTPEDDPSCTRATPLGALGRRIFGAGNERTTFGFPDGFGYHIEERDLWTGIFEFMNFTDEIQTAFLRMDVRFLPDTDPSVKAAEPWWLDVEQCEDSAWDVPAGESEWWGDQQARFTGRVVSVAGHPHDGGVSVTLDNRSTGERICKTVAGYGTKPAHQGHLESMSTCVWDRLASVRKGETLRVTTVYNPSEPQEDVMGIMMAWVYETDDLDGGTPAPESVRNPPDGAPPPAGGDHSH